MPQPGVWLFCRPCNPDVHNFIGISTTNSLNLVICGCRDLSTDDAETQRFDVKAWREDRMQRLGGSHQSSRCSRCQPLPMTMNSQRGLRPQPKRDLFQPQRARRIAEDRKRRADRDFSASSVVNPADFVSPVPPWILPALSRF